VRIGSHLHTLTTSQTYYGLAGLLAIGRPDGNLPLVTANRIPIRNMVLQYNYVFDRIGGLAQLNNVNWPQYVSTITPPKGDELGRSVLDSQLCLHTRVRTACRCPARHLDHCQTVLSF
jgi:hypothetical protein